MPTVKISDESFQTNLFTHFTVEMYETGCVGF